MLAGAQIGRLGALGPDRVARRIGGGAFWCAPRPRSGHPPRIFPVRFRSPLPHASRRGVTLMESVLFLAIVLSVVLGGLVYYHHTSEAARVSQAVRDISALVAKVRAAFDPHTDFSGLTPAVLIMGGAVPTGMTNTAQGTIKSPWGRIDIGPLPDDPQRFAVTLTDLPVPACTRMGPYSSRGTGIFAERVVNFETQTAAGSFVAADGELRAGRDTNGVSPAEAATACAAQGTTRTQARWTFEK